MQGAGWVKRSGTTVDYCNLPTGTRLKTTSLIQAHSSLACWKHRLLRLPPPGGAISVWWAASLLWGRRLPDTGGKEKVMFARVLECQAKNRKGAKTSTKV